MNVYELYLPLVNWKHAIVKLLICDYAALPHPTTPQTITSEISNVFTYV